MTTRSYAEVRQDFATRIEAIGGDWNESPLVAQSMGPEAVANAISAQRGHLTFAVDVTKSEAVQQRQRAADGIRVRSTVAVRFLARQKRSTTAALDAALDAEVALVAQLLTFDDTWPVYFHVIYTGSDRRALATGEWFDITCSFSVDHRIDLS